LALTNQANLPKYDPSMEATFTGTVDKVVEKQSTGGGGLATHLILKLENGNAIEVHVAPTKFLKTYDLIFQQGDKLDVIGSRVTFEGAEIILAREVRRGQDTYVFRDKDGKPVW